ncbi:molybdate ABC transporter substrate-binding protein [Flagellimonas algicola]|uniref:Molybdate ABC transporter substrate-binding protein n=1 Tax=Flagellimonas algicola TaxID=2583815 RepID=A0ABY2WP19_9FLAO|nr:molybdate ABC transporter substrate-binding protein [Allomuricauda algicola]TMU56747.1 molybdate ABC transporter substrate-binding protein [Allomuricauda algicola]
MNKVHLLILLAILFVLGLGCNPRGNSDKLTIAVSSNMQYSIEEIAAKYTEHTGIACDLVVGSSGKLTAQIMEGAPFDVFLSADMKYPQMLYQKGHAKAAPKIYALGKLVLFASNKEIVPKLEFLKNDSIAHIALANPKTAPYGRAAMEVLEHNGLVYSVKDKLVYGESVSQTNQFMSTGAAQMGFTAKSTLIGTPLSQQGHWIALDTNSYTPIQQGIVMLEDDTAQDRASLSFLEFIFTEEAQEILKKYGYSTHE